MGELVDRGVRAGILFVFIWAILWTMNNYGCAQIPGHEMEPEIERGGWQLGSPFHGKPDVSKDNVVTYEVWNRNKNQSLFVGKIVFTPGQMATLPSVLNWQDGMPIGSDEQVTLLVPRDHLIILADNKGAQNADSRAFGPVDIAALQKSVR